MITYTIPQELLDRQVNAKLMKSGKQWSRIVAWSWSDILAYEGDKKNVENEKNLKDFLRKTVEAQAKNIAAAIIYGDEESANKATKFTKIIKALFQSDPIDFTQLEDEDAEKLKGNDLTLSKVLSKLANPDSNPNGKEPITGFIPTVERDFFESFSYEASIVPLPVPIRSHKKIPYYSILDPIHDEKTKYIINLHYPPRPNLGENTFTEKQLEDWMRDKGENVDYLPPSAYMVLSPS